MSAPIIAQAVTELLRLAPSTAVLLTKDEHGRTVSEEEVPTALVQRGDLLKVCRTLLSPPQTEKGPLMQKSRTSSSGGGNAGLLLAAVP